MKSWLKSFEAFGIELEYMIVDRNSLSVKPIADELLKHQLGSYGSDFDNGLISWSNELSLHVIEIKSTKPESNFSALENGFADNIEFINSILKNWDAMLMPGGAHPLMNPVLESKLWPHDSNEVYHIYDKIFDCRGHGWTNLQSTHLNLPFENDEEFGKLHAAIRIVLPILPALCASSPILEGTSTGLKDTRLKFYKTNQQKIPTISGRIIPEAIFSERKYNQVIYQQIRNDIAPYNSKQILDPVWVNSRGAIARFDRGAIEIRVMDVQECPSADLAICKLVIETLKFLFNENEITFEEQIKAKTEILSGIFDDVIVQGQNTEILSSEYLSFFGLSEFTTAGKIWEHMFKKLSSNKSRPLANWENELSIILNQGNLADRVLTATGEKPSSEKIKEVYRKLCGCLDQNKLFIL